MRTYLVRRLAVLTALVSACSITSARAKHDPSPVGKTLIAMARAIVADASNDILASAGDYEANIAGKPYDQGNGLGNANAPHIAWLQVAEKGIRPPDCVTANRQIAQVETLWQAGQITDADIAGQLNGDIYIPVQHAVQAASDSMRIAVYKYAALKNYNDTITQIGKSTSMGPYFDANHANVGSFVSQMNQLMKDGLGGYAGKISAMQATLADRFYKYLDELNGLYKYEAGQSVRKNDPFDYASNTFKTEYTSWFQGGKAPISDEIQKGVKPVTMGNPALCRICDIPEFDFAYSLNPAVTVPSESGFIQTPVLQALVDATVQPFINGRRVTAIGFNLTPKPPTTVQKGKPKWSFWDAVIVPNKDDVYTPSSDAAGNDDYDLFIYGPQVPANKGELASLSSSESGIHYDVIAFDDDLKAGKASGPAAEALLRAHLAISHSLTDATANDRFNKMMRMLVLVKAAPGVLPGAKSIVINGIEVPWFLDHGPTKATFALVRQTNFSTTGVRLPTPVTEPVNRLFIGDYIRAEVKPLSKVSVNTIDVVFGRNGFALPVINGQDTVPATLGAGGVYATPWIKLVPESDLRLDPRCPANLKEAGVTYMAADSLQTIHAVVADPKQFKLDHVGATAWVEPSPRLTLWRDALRAAAIADGMPNDYRVDYSHLQNVQVESFSNVILTNAIFRSLKESTQFVYLRAYMALLEAWTGVSFSRGDTVQVTTIKLGDHAAMLLLRDRFVELMDEQLAALHLLTTDGLRRKFMEQAGTDPKSPVAQITLGSKSVKDLVALEKFGSSQQFVNQAFQQTFQTYLSKVQAARDYAVSIQPGEIDRLLALTGFGFGPVVADLLPDLYMRRNPDDEDEAPAMVKDRFARSYVQAIENKFEELEDQRHLNTLDTQVLMMTASILPVTIPAVGLPMTIAKVATGVALGFSQVIDAHQLDVEHISQEKAFAFSQGAYGVLGSGRIDLAELKRVPGWQVVVGYIGGVASAGGAALELYQAMGSLSKAAAAQRAAPVIRLLKPGNGVATINSLKPADKAAVLVTALQKEAVVGVDAALIESAQAAKDERAVLAQLMKELNADVQQQAHSTAVINKFFDFTPVSLASDSETSFNLAEFMESTSMNERVNTLTEVTYSQPVAPGEWKAPDGSTLKLGTQLTGGEGQPKTMTFNVWLDPTNKRVIKIMHPCDLNYAKQDFTDIFAAKAELDRIGVPYKAIDAHPEGRYLFQEAVGNNFAQRSESFIVSNYFKQQKLIGGKLYTPARLNPEHENSIMAMINKFVKGNSVPEDFKFDAIYLERKANALECGYVDIDRVAPVDKMTNAIDGVLDQIERGVRYDHELDKEVPRVFDGLFFPDGAKDPSLHYFRNSEEAMEILFVRRGMVVYDATTQTWVDGRMSVNIVKRVLSRFGEKGPLDFRGRIPARPTLPRHSLLWLHTPQHYAYAA